MVVCPLVQILMMDVDIQLKTENEQFTAVMMDTQ